MTDITAEQVNDYLTSQQNKRVAWLISELCEAVGIDPAEVQTVTWRGRWSG